MSKIEQVGDRLPLVAGGGDDVAAFGDLGVAMPSSCRAEQPAAGGTGAHA